MSEVKRYSFWPQIVHLPGGGGVRAEVHFKVEEDGLFVAHQDYARLKAEVKRLRCLSDELNNTTEYLELENERLRKASEWKTIETAPKDGKTVVLVVEYGYVYTGIFHNNDYCQDLYGAGLDPTHWMPLPQPPKQEEKQS